MVGVLAARLEVQRQPRLHREALERVPVESGHGHLRVRPLDEVDGAAGERLVHRHVGGAVARQTVARAERVCERIAERREDVLGRVMLVDLEVAACEHFEIEPAVEGERREEVVEQPDAGGDPRPARAVEVERDAERRLVRGARDQSRPPRGR